MIVAPDAAAIVTSLSVMPPTARCTNDTFTSSRSSFRRLWVTASSEPCTSAFNTKVSVAVSPLRIASKRSSSFAPGLVDRVEACARVVKRSRCSRASPTVRAIERSEVTLSSSPAIGGSDSPSTCTGMEGNASLIWSPRSLINALTRPHAAPATIGSPTRNVPLCTMIVATGPRPMSRFDSSTTPLASTSVSAPSSSTSARTTSCSKSSSMPKFCRAEISTVMVSPPQASGTSPCSESCCSTRLGSASALSILLIAVTIGTLAALAWLIASTVWGITPSSAATTSTTMSVTLAPPRASP